MTRFLARRAAMAVLTLLAVIVLTFALVHSIPGSPGAVMLGPGASAQEIHAQNELLGWNQPLAVQFWDWITHAVRGDLGTSLTGGNEVGPDLASRLPVTAAIALGATALSGVLGIVSGVVAAVRGGLVDRFITAFSGIVVSLPTFWLGILLVYVASIRLGWLPATGYTPSRTHPSTGRRAWPFRCSAWRSAGLPSWPGRRAPPWSRPWGRNTSGPCARQG